MRGKALISVKDVKQARITPAYAGKSGAGGHGQRWHRDHPRVCGEKPHFLPQTGAAMGSPPRMRGKVLFWAKRLCGRRITPAYAGKSFRLSDSGSLKKDHPRVCGEKPPPSRSTAATRGSPPRMRGKEAGDRYDLDRPGITPAYAGKRLKRSHSIGHFSCILCLFHSVLHRASVSDGSRAGPCAPPCLPAQNAVPV